MRNYFIGDQRSLYNCNIVISIKIDRVRCHWAHNLILIFQILDYDEIFQCSD